MSVLFLYIVIYYDFREMIAISAVRQLYKYVANLTDEELESWYDETYQMLLLSILELDNIERNKKVTSSRRFSASPALVRPLQWQISFRH